MKNKYLIYVLIFILTLLSLILFIEKNNAVNSNVNDNPIDKTTCTLIKTYTIKNIFNSDDNNYLYIAISQFQNEEIYIVKIPKNISSNIEIDKNYEFTLNIDKDYLNTKDDILFEKADLISINTTDKIGLEQVNTINCN